MSFNIRKGLIYRYAQYKFEQYIKDNVAFESISHEEKVSLCETIAKKACIVLVLLVFPYFILVMYAFYLLSIQGNVLVSWFYHWVDEAYEIILYGDWGVNTPHKRGVLFLIFIKLLPVILGVLISLTPIFLCNAIVINSLLKTKLKMYLSK